MDGLPCGNFIIKLSNVLFICLSSALVPQSINICTCHVYRCLSKSLSHIFTILATIHPDSSKTVKSRFIGIEIQHQ